MYQNGMIYKLFPTQIYQAPIDRNPEQLIKDLIREAKIIEKTDEEGIEWSKKHYKGGFTSYGSMDRLHLFSTSFETLKKKIDLHLKKYISELEMDIDTKELQMSRCWVNIMPAGSTHTMHIHPLSVISGTFYVQTPPQSSPLKFEDPRLVNFMASPPRKPKASTDNQRFYSLKPKAGDIVFFESWVRHEVPPHQAKTDRISVSFNYDWC